MVKTADNYPCLHLTLPRAYRHHRNTVVAVNVKDKDNVRVNVRVKDSVRAHLNQAATEDQAITEVQKHAARTIVMARTATTTHATATIVAMIIATVPAAAAIIALATIVAATIVTTTTAAAATIAIAIAVAVTIAGTMNAREINQKVNKRIHQLQPVRAKALRNKKAGDRFLSDSVHRS